MKAATAVVCFECGELSEPAPEGTVSRCPKDRARTYPLRWLLPKYDPDEGFKSQDDYERARTLGQVEPVEADIIDGRLVRK